MSTSTEAAKAKKLGGYHVLMQTDEQDGLRLVGKNITAASAKAAVLIYAAKVPDALRSEKPEVYVAVPSRSWNPLPIVVETTTKLRIAP